jgi:hypothetical protein
LGNLQNSGEKSGKQVKNLERPARGAEGKTYGEEENGGSEKGKTCGEEEKAETESAKGKRRGPQGPRESPEGQAQEFSGKGPCRMEVLSAASLARKVVREMPSNSLAWT